MALAVAANGQTLSGTTWTINGTNFGPGVVFNGTAANLPRPVAPGDKIVVNFTSRSDYFGFENLVGTVANPIVITNGANVQVVQDRNNAPLGSTIGITGCQNVIIRGDFDGTVPLPTNTTDTIRYGFKIDCELAYRLGYNAAKPGYNAADPAASLNPAGQNRGGLEINNSRNITIDRVLLANQAFSGIRANQNSANIGFVRILNSKISGTWYEAVYLGNTNGAVVSNMDSARIENCIIENVWNNAVQFARLQNGGRAIVRNTTFRNISNNQAFSGQVGGVTWGQNGTGLVENCVFENVGGEWITQLATGKVVLRNNIVTASKGVFWNNNGATDTLIVERNTVVIRAATPSPGFNAVPFTSAGTVFVNQASPGRLIYRNNLTVNTSPTPGELNNFATGIVTQSNNYYATALGVLNGFVSTTATLALPSRRSIGNPSFTPDVRLAGATNATRGANPALLLWPAVGGGQAPPTAPGFPGITNITTTGATASFAASTSAGGTITRYRVFVNGVQLADSTASLTRTITGLAPNTTYSVAVRAVDNLGQVGPQNVNSFTTLSGAPPVDVTAPTTPGTPTFSLISANSARVTTTGSTDAIGVTGYVFRLNGVALADVGPGLIRDLSNLAASTSYSMTVQAVDAAGNLSTISPANSFTTFALAGGDVTRPSIPGTPTFSLITMSTATIGFVGSTDNVGVARYVVRLNGVALADSTASLSRNLTGLAANVIYTVTVQAVDAAGNRSIPGPGAAFTTRSVAIGNIGKWITILKPDGRAAILVTDIIFTLSVDGVFNIVNKANGLIYESFTRAKIMNSAVSDEALFIELVTLFNLAN